MNKLSILIFIITVITYVHAVAVDVNKLYTRNDGDPIIATVENEQVFCTFLPRKAGEEIGASEDDAIAFCSVQSVNAPNAGLFPEGLVRTMHFEQGDNYVQITGTIDSSKYVVLTDTGGQYDPKAPQGASCHGYDTFVNLVEPNLGDEKNPSGIGHFCIRCCNGPDADSLCPLNRSTDGCEQIIQGDYS
ncbi:1844_t:CDS:1 [Racocetra fulgida]|uniref:1844_t:CDS:1 n=1 Tax=Racocetra fulgida TaxID=60492 RepID=A0A9N9GSZ6_9GLOM|nr:1844_t:CDS:1 [Racocetra fulgida]